MDSTLNFPSPPLRIGLLLDSLTQPRWVHRIVTQIQASACAQIALVVLNGGPAGEHTAAPAGLRKLAVYRHDLLYLLYRKLDERLFAPPGHAFEPVDLTPLLGDCPTLTVRPVQKKYSDYLQPEDFAAIRVADLDVALRFGFRILRGDFLKIARYGVWSYHHGDNAVNRGGPPGFWEVMEGEPVTGTLLQVLSEQLDGGQVLYRSYAATDPHSVIRSKNAAYWKSAEFVMRKLNDLHAHGPQALEHPNANGRYRPYSHRLYKQPHNAEMLPLLWRWARRYAGAKLTYALNTYQWFLAYQTGPAASRQPSLYRFKPITPPKDRFWADPFPVRRGERFYIFLEEYLFARRKGHIAVLEMDLQGNWQPPRPVLEDAAHLSYPFVFEWRSELFMIPESSEKRTVELYRCTSFPDRWTLETVLFDGVTAADTTLAEIDGRWWLFTNMAAEGASKNDELHLFSADSPLGPWRPHRANPVVSDVRSARPAGRPFRWNGIWHRPSQDCSRTYGYATVLNEIVQLNADCYEERPVGRIEPRWAPGLIATHTFNQIDGLVVVDALKLRRKWR